MAEENWWGGNAKFPCKNCPDRHLACWQHCEKYKQAKKKHQENRQKEMNEKTVGYMAYSVRHRHYRPIRKRGCGDIDE